MLNVRVNFAGIERRLERNVERGKFILASQVLADTNNYVPELSGDLKRYANISNDNESITWTQPYARFQYYAQGNFNYTKPGTGPRWVDVAMSRHVDSWRRIVGSEFR